MRLSLGALAAGLLLAIHSVAGYRAVILADAASFVAMVIGWPALPEGVA